MTFYTQTPNVAVMLAVMTGCVNLFIKRDRQIIYFTIEHPVCYGSPNDITIAAHGGSPAMPRTTRMLIKDQKSVYHVITRTALDGLPFGPVEKDR
ncbi:hypothetical protein, partial [Desulfatiferula olefinivorans]